MMTEEQIAAARAQLEKERQHATEQEAIEIEREKRRHLDRVKLVKLDLQPVFAELEQQYGSEVMLSVHLCRIATILRAIGDQCPSLGARMVDSVAKALSKTYHTGESQCVVLTERVSNPRRSG